MSAAQLHKLIIFVVVNWVNCLVVHNTWSQGGPTVIMSQCCCHTVVVVSQTVINSLKICHLLRSLWGWKTFQSCCFYLRCSRCLLLVAPLSTAFEWLSKSFSSCTKSLIKWRGMTNVKSEEDAGSLGTIHILHRSIFLDFLGPLNPKLDYFLLLLNTESK